MKQEEIIHYLVEIYIHGYFLNDPQYNKILLFLVDKVIQSKKETEIQDTLKQLIGVYNDLTDKIYTDVVIYVCKINKKKYNSNSLMRMLF